MALEVTLPCLLCFGRVCCVTIGDIPRAPRRTDGRNNAGDRIEFMIWEGKEGRKRRDNVLFSHWLCELCEL